MSTFTVKEGQADPVLHLLPLHVPGVSGAVADDLNSGVHGKYCAGCCKPFNAARKQRMVGRVRHVDPIAGTVFVTAWVFCGRCAREIRRDGLPAALMKEARAATAAGLLLAAPAEGNA